MASTMLDPIREQVNRLKTVVDSNKALLQLLFQKVLDAPTIEEAHAIAQEVLDQNDELAADVVAHTPAENPTPTPNPEPSPEARHRR